MGLAHFPVDGLEEAALVVVDAVAAADPVAGDTHFTMVILPGGTALPQAVPQGPGRRGGLFVVEVVVVVDKST